MQFHSHLSDMSKQDASTTHAHLICLLNKLCGTSEVKARKTTILDHSDRCSKKYRCGTALYLLSVLSSQFGVTIDRMIGAPGHVKDLIVEEKPKQPALLGSVCAFVWQKREKTVLKHLPNMESVKRLPKSPDGIIISKRARMSI
jgi:hypothetical protein